MPSHLARLEETLANGGRLAPYVRHRFEEQHRAAAAFLTVHTPEIAE